MKNHKPYKSRIGDVAGDIKSDPLFVPSWDYEEMKNHFYKMEACNGFLDAFEFAYHKFEEENGEEK